MKHLKLIFRSLLKNDAVVDAARTYGVIGMLVVFFFSLTISLIPTMVSLLTQDVGTFITSSSYNIDIGIQNTLSQLEKDNMDILVFSETNEKISKGEKGYVQLENNNTEKTWLIDQPIKTNMTVNGGTSIDSPEDKDIIVFEVYNAIEIDSRIESDYPLVTEEYDTEIGRHNAYFRDRVNVILQSKHLLSKPDDATTATSRTASFMVVGKYSYAIYKFNSGGTSSAYVTNITGDYSLIEVNSFNDLYSNDLDTLVSNVALFLNQGYRTTLVFSFWVNFGITAGINVGLFIIVALIFFLVSRGKSNPFNIYTWYECFYMAAWNMITPAILVLILGFMMQGVIGMFLFVLFYGIRSMYLAMRQLRPAPSGS